MSEPMSVLSLAMAAGGGLVDGREAQQWLAAGYGLLSRSVQLVRALSDKRAAILLPPGGAYLTALAASDGRGTVLINPLASRPEIVRQILDANVGAVFTNLELATHLPIGIAFALLDEAPLFAQVSIDGVTRTVDLGNHFGLSLSGRTDVEGRDEEAVIVYTSAMAGRPLGAILTHRNLIANAHASADALGDTSDDKCLSALPFAHLFGLIVCAVSPLVRGGNIALMSRFHPGRALDVIEESRITRFMGVPSMFLSMLQVIGRRGNGRFVDHNLRMCLTGGAPVSEQLQTEWFDATGVELRQGYGLTEAAPACTLSRHDQTNRRGAMGTPIAGMDVTIQNPNGDELPNETEGEICIRGPHVFRGYVSSGEDGLEMRNGWLRTGDLAVKHEDNTYTFRGLIKAMFTRNGFNIYPREIEAAISRMPGVVNVQASAVPHPVRENDIAVSVTGDVTESNVKAWAEQELATYKVPSHFVVDGSGRTG
ncbi:MAG: AMP-binding protein [Gemmatimonadaceae bacterium]